MKKIIKSNFIGDFKAGDNISHNMRTLEILYKYYENGDSAEKNLLCKPIIVIIVSIIEAIHYDLHYRITKFTREGLNGISDDILKDIRNKKHDKFDKLIACVKKHNLFQVKKTVLYDRLDELRKLRNRIHIQNTKGEFERDDSEAFSEARKVLAEKVLEKILKTMADKYGRGDDFSYVADFMLPWNEHFES